MPTGVLHLKEVDTDKITLDGTLSVSGEARLKGSTVIVDNALSVGTTTTLAADTTATNVNLTGTLSVSGQTTIGGDILPDTNDAYDIGSPEFKIRDLYVSNNSIWVGDDMKISNVNGSLKFRKRKTDEVPKAILDAGANAGHANEQATADAALAHAGVTNVADMKLQHWFKFMRTLNAAAKLTDIFRDNDDDYEETSASDAWKEIADANKIYTSSAVGVGTSDPDDTLHVKGSFKVESETGFKLIRSSVGGTDPTVIIDTQNFGTDNTVNDLTGRGDSKYTKLYRVFGRNSEGVGKSWYWGYANDDYTNFSLAFDGGGLPDPDIAFTFTTASELYCNKVYAALGGNADTATRLATPRKINGVDFDGTQDITIDTGSDGVDGITSVNGNIGIGTSTPTATLQVEGSTAQSGIYSKRLWVTGVGDNSGVGSPDDNTGSPWYGLGYDDLAWNVQSQRYPGKIPILSGYSGVALRSGAGNLVLTTAGDVGVGTAAPTEKLHIKDGNIRLDDTGTVSIQNKHDSSDYGTLELSSGYRGGSSRPKISIVGYTGAATVNGDNVIKFHTNGSQRMIVNQSGNVGIGTSTPSGKVHINGGRVHYTHTTPTFNGLLDPSDAGGRAQFVITSAYTDLVLASSKLNNVHGSTISFTAVDPDNSSDYRKFVIGQGNWGQRKHLLHFGYDDANHANPHLYYGDHYAYRHRNVMTLNGITKSVHVNGPLQLPNNYGTCELKLGTGDGNGSSVWNTVYRTWWSIGVTDYAQSRRIWFDARSGDIRGAGNVSSYSDDRIKINEKHITRATETLAKLDPQIYHKSNAPDALKHDDEKFVTESGLIAQDVWYDAPELRHLVSLGSGAKPNEQRPVRNKDLTIDPDYSGWGPSVATVNYVGLIPYLVKSIQEIESQMPYVKSKVSNVDVSNVVDHHGLIVSVGSNGGLHVSNRSLDTKCYGVIERKYADTVDNEVMVNTSKNGKIWIISKQNIEAGDFITTSEVNGFGMKQTDDILRSHTVAKALRDCDFNPKLEKVKRVSKEITKKTYYVRKEYSDVPQSEHKDYIQEESIVEIDELYYKRISGSDDEDTLEEELDEPQFYDLNESLKAKYEKAFRRKKKIVTKFEFDSPVPGCEKEEREELVDKLDSNGQIIWEETEETVPEYMVKYIDVNGKETNESNHTYKAALIDCKLLL